MKKNYRISEALKYTLAGVVFGIVFPILSTSIEIIEHDMSFKLSSVVTAHSQNPFLWVIDCAIPILGFMGYQIGIRQQRLLDQAGHLEEMVNERSEEILRQKLFYEALVEHSPVAIATLDPNHLIVSVNPAFEKVFGYQAKKIIGKNLDDLVSNPENTQEAISLTQQVLDGDTIHAFGKRRRKDGELVDVEILGEPIEIRGTQIGVLGLYRDVTTEKKALDDLQASEERFRRMFNDSPVALRMEDLSKMRQWVLERQQESGMDIREYLENYPEEFPTLAQQMEIISLNAASLQLFNAKNKKDLQKNYATILSEESRREQIEIICALLDGETSQEKELIYDSLDGKKLYVITKLSILPGHESDWSRVLFSNMDITERKLAEERLSYISLHDMMTGLYNRAFFEEEMARMERSRTRPISILVCDMDNLKKFNDLYGHQAGDSALKTIANIFERSLRAEDVIARIGGDEFAILLPNVSADLAKMVKQRILRHLDMHNRTTSEDKRISLSIGIATSVNEDDFEDVFKQADENMYQEKLKKKKVKVPS